MPELPEVETTLRGVEPHLTGKTIQAIDIRDPRLRQPVPESVAFAVGQEVTSLSRRAKYLLIHLETGCLLIHLGMSGSLRVLSEAVSPGKHDHFDISVADRIIRYNDPRRFGLFLWLDTPPLSHPLLRHLGPEPLSGEFTGEWLYRKARGRKLAVKNFIMDGKIVVGVGNIYASEALFMAGINPLRAAGRISKNRFDGLAAAIRDVLRRAIRLGGTTLRDFIDTEGLPGYFAQELLVYGREGKPCFQCGDGIRSRVIGQRNSFYCINCQT